MAAAAFRCPVDGCRWFVSTKSFATTVAHVRSWHRIVTDFKCQFCGPSLCSFNSWRMHMLRYHGMSARRQSRSRSLESGFEAAQATPDVEIDESAVTLGSNASSLDISRDLRVSDNGILTEFGLLYMKIREHYGLPITVANGVLNDFVKFYEGNKKNCENWCGLDLNKFWDYFSKKENYRRFCLLNGLVEPVQVSLEEDGFSNRFCYIPLIESLKKYLSHRDVLAMILDKADIAFSTNFSGDGILRDFSDGEYFKSSNYFMGDCSYLRIHLYIDELEVCNPLGSSRCRYKLTCMYYTVGNIDSKYLSCLKNINVLLIAKSSTIRSFGYDAVLERATRDFLILENEGIKFQLDGQTFFFKGGLATISGDNLGSHDIGGFRKCFSSGRICRYCMCCYEDLLTKTCENAFEMRTIESHRMHIQALLTDTSLGSAYGVLRDSPFKTLASYHVISGLPPDIMHDMLEGVIPITMDVVVEKLIGSRVISKVVINKRIGAFVYGRNDLRNVPKKNSLQFYSMTASETWCIFRSLPFMIGDLVPIEDDLWNLYLLLASICDIVFAPAIQEQWVPYLDVLVADFYSHFKSISPSNLKPKFHFMLHYSSLMKKFGPLRKMWCMRFEAYHQNVKKFIRRSKNFRNVCLTAAKRIQLIMKCWEGVGSNILCGTTTFTCAKTVELSDVPAHLRSVLTNVLAGDRPEETLLMVSSLHHDSRQYFTDTVELIENGDMPVFCIITDIFRWHDLWYLYGRKLHTTHFCRHLHIYHVLKLLNT